MTDIDYGAAWGRLETGTTQANAVPVPVSKYNHYRPFTAAVNEYVDEAQEENRILLGLDAIDREMRGLGRNHLLLLNGFTHSGKTQLTLHALRHNRTKRVAMFTPDETAATILANLASQQTGVPSIELEQRIQRDDQEAIELLRQAAEEFPNLAVFEQRLNPGFIDEALTEAEDAWGAPADLIVIDYVRLLRMGEDNDEKFEYLKSLSKRKRSGPVIALHQTSRTKGAAGRVMTIESGEYGGESEASFVLGVRRKKYEWAAEVNELEFKLRHSPNGKSADTTRNLLANARYELGKHEHTVTVNLVKVKRAGGRLVDEIDYELDQATGRILPMDGEMTEQYRRQQRGFGGYGGSYTPSDDYEHGEMF